MSRTKLLTGSGVLALIVVTLFMLWVHSATMHQPENSVSGLPLGEGASVQSFANGGRLNAPGAFWTAVPRVIPTDPPLPPSPTSPNVSGLPSYATPGPTQLARLRDLSELNRLEWNGGGIVIMSGTMPSPVGFRAPGSAGTQPASYQVEEVPLGRTFVLRGLYSMGNLSPNVQELPDTIDKVWRLTITDPGGFFYIGANGWNVYIDETCLGYAQERSNRLVAIIYDGSLLHERMNVSADYGSPCLPR